MKKKALVIGINEYEDSGFEKLKYAESDAETIHELLINPDIGDFKEEDVISLRETVKSEVEENLEIILSEAKREDLVFIYFAGHGKLDSLGSLCLVVRNTKIDKFFATSVHLDYIRRIIDYSDCKRIVFIIDSCFSGAIGQSFRSGEVPADSFEQLSGQGKVIISASQAYERARELDDLRHGIFTYYLAMGLAQGEADYDRDGFISIEDLYRYVYTNVKAATKGKQIPVKWGIDEKGEIIIAKSIKVLEKKKAEVEGLLKKAQELENQERLDEALKYLEMALRLSSASIEAQQRIIQIKEEQKKRAEIEIKTDRLFEYYQAGDIPASIYNKAVEIIKNPYSTLIDKIFSRLIDDLLNGSLSVENFIRSWDRVEKPRNQIGIEKKQEEEHKDQTQRQIQEEEHQPSYKGKIEDVSEPSLEYQAKKWLKTFKWLKWVAVVIVGFIILISGYNYLFLSPINRPKHNNAEERIKHVPLVPHDQPAWQFELEDVARNIEQGLAEVEGKDFTDQQSLQLLEIIVKHQIELGDVALNIGQYVLADVEWKDFTPPLGKAELKDPSKGPLVKERTPHKPRPQPNRYSFTRFPVKPKPWSNPPTLPNHQGWNH